MGRGEPEVVGVEVDGVGRGRVGGLLRWQGLVEVDDGDSAGCVQSEGSESDGVCEQSAGLSVGEKLSESLDGVGGVEWDVGAACFEDGEQTDEHVGSAVDADGDAGVWLDA
jgi:hypothetical protein